MSRKVLFSVGFGQFVTARKGLCRLGFLARYLNCPDTLATIEAAMTYKCRFTFVSDGEKYSAVAILHTRCWSMQIERLPGLVFRFDNDDLEKAMLLLPTDKLGGQPSIACWVNETPVLEDAVPAALWAVLGRRGIISER